MAGYPLQGGIGKDHVDRPLRQPLGKIANREPQSTPCIPEATEVTEATEATEATILVTGPR
ncbi:hypothetical protein GCM10027176_78660 [Actinoallomurus bryophytorum]